MHNYYESSKSINIYPIQKRSIARIDDYQLTTSTQYVGNRSLFGSIQKIAPKLLISLLVIVLILLSTSAYSASDSPNETSSQQSAAAQAPDNLLDYTEQQFNKVQKDGVDFPDSLADVLTTDDKDVVDQAGQLQADPALTGDYNQSYYPLKTLNAHLATLSKPANLSTPLSTLEFFQSAIIKERYDLAAHALNMNLLDDDTQSNRSAELAERLDFLLSNKGLYVFDNLPDRADGLIEPPIGSSSSISGIPRRSIKLGVINYRDRQVPLYIERVRVNDDAPIWVFSAQTVGNIDNLYDQYEPPKFEQYIPNWMTLRFFGMAVWEFLALVLFFFVTMGIGWLVSQFTGKLVSWYVGDKDLSSLSHSKKSITDFIDKLIVPLTFTIGFSLVFTLVSGSLPFIEPIAMSTRPIMWIGLVVSAVWLGIRVINYFASRYKDLQIDGLAEDEYNKYRVRLTYLSIFRRLFIFVMIIGSIWIGVSEFTNIEGLGKTLLTSAGIAGVVLGVAAQPTLGNIVAGLQVAITQPIRIGDTVMMEGSWTTIEDLRYTYAVLKTWDERRLIVPMRHFVTEIVENWSHTEFHQTCVVYLYVDYGVDVDAIRQKFIEKVKNHDLWDQETEPAVLVVSVDEDTIKLRGALASDSPLNAWRLECDIREQMLTYLSDEQEPYLPAERITFK